MPEAGGHETEAPERPEPVPLGRRLIAAGVVLSMAATLAPGVLYAVLEALRPTPVHGPRAP